MWVKVRVPTPGCTWTRRRCSRCSGTTPLRLKLISRPVAPIETLRIHVGRYFDIYNPREAAHLRCSPGYTRSGHCRHPASATALAKIYNPVTATIKLDNNWQSSASTIALPLGQSQLDKQPAWTPPLCLRRRMTVLRCTPNSKTQASSRLRLQML